MKREILAKKGKETQGKRTDLLSNIDNKLPEHNTQKEIAKSLNWSTGKKAPRCGGASLWCYAVRLLCHVIHRQERQVLFLCQ